MNIREQTERLEQEVLSSFAQLCSKSRGRSREEKKCEIRTDYQRDRDRIIHSKSFRRLKHKTQVFITPEGDHYRTRLTHTLEVAQIARTIARGLRLNEDLTEAIALGHDLGHTPFGHAGEYVLNKICPHGFKHYEQSLRVVDILENGKGMNLTYEVRDGIVNHTGDHMASTLEGQIIKYADRIAYINHDIDDAIRGGILNMDNMPKHCTEILGESHGRRINTMITDIIYQSQNKNCVNMSKEVYQATMDLRKFMFDTVYVGSTAKKEEQKAQNIVIELYDYFIKYPEKLPQEMGILFDKEDKHRIVCDYIAGMTDRYAIQKFYEIFIPASWRKV
ncbi:deoxyguanosinetriphosphate triphosphohydrolase [Petroclostridium sp. X23]|uniref:deoxyguanosinetriphosphate triphosphohydrolase n=1 Tax=Petroclostridium sp. X23 TaxID=3045146 RepID=UPI0024AE367D|nr:deoxyguanosinetriphosphate triphosphohydrolase [Petroclostridium sp. X23]WHH59570.1 deoxyguanosinetriphosphate triphosphohydrolase [Petroclostridium sp. X23]